MTVVAAFFLLFFAWFLTHAAPSVYFGDCGEILAALHTGGIPHPTGFPTYMLLGTPFSRCGTFAVNILSAVAASLSLVLLRFLSMEMLTRTGYKEDSAAHHSWIAPLLMLGCGTLTLQAGVARVYVVQLCFLLALLSCTLRYRPTFRWALGWGLLFGLSSGTHMLFLLAIPFTFLWLGKRLSADLTLTGFPMALGVLLGISIHLWTPLRSALQPEVNWGDPSQWSRWTAYMRQEAYGYKMFARDAPGTVLFVRQMVRLLAQEMNPAFMLLTAWGVWTLRKFFGSTTAPLLSVVVMNLTMVFLYGGEFDLQVLYRYLLPSFAMAALIASIGWVHLWEHWTPVRFRTKRTLWVTLFLMGLISLSAPFHRWRDLSSASFCGNYALNLFRSVPRNATLEVATDKQVFPVAYLRFVHGLRPDVKILNWFDTLFPEAVRRLKTTPGLSKSLLEGEYFRESGGVLFLPEMRRVPTPSLCLDWGLSYRWADASKFMGVQAPPLHLFRTRINKAEISDPEAQEALSVLYLKEGAQWAARGDLPKTLEVLQKVEDHCADSPNALVNAAVQYLRLREVPRAEALLRKVLDHRPNHYTAQVNMGIVYAFRGDRENALKSWETAAQAAVGNTEAIAFLNALKTRILAQPVSP